MALHACVGSGECAMKNGHAALILAIAGAVVWLPLISANSVLNRPPNDAWTLWYWIGYPLLLLLSLGVGYWTGKAPWFHGLLAVAGSYVAALILVPHTGNLLPFELLWMAILAVPAALLERAGAKWQIDSQSHPTTSHQSDDSPRR